MPPPQVTDPIVFDDCEEVQLYDRDFVQYTWDPNIQPVSQGSGPNTMASFYSKEPQQIRRSAMSLVESESGSEARDGKRMSIRDVLRMQEAKKRQAQSQEQVELCGESFIKEIHKMLDDYDALESNAADNGNKDHKSAAVSDTQFSENKDLQDTEASRKLLGEFSHLLKQRASFFRKVKMDANLRSDQIDDKLAFFNVCMREKVLCFPFLNKIQDYTLVLKNVVLNHGVSGAIKAVMQKIPNLVRHLFLDTNGLTGPST